MDRELLSQKRSAAGRIGGGQTLMRYGREHYSMAGKLGGRPRVDLAEKLVQAQAAEAREIKRRICPRGMTELRRFLRTEIKEGANPSAAD